MMIKRAKYVLWIVTVVSLIGMTPLNLPAQSGTPEKQNSILHVSGYAHTGFEYEVDGASSFTIGSFSPIFHFLYKELLLMETELEIEAEEDGSTGLMMEYLTLDLFLNDYVTLVVGKYLSPLGQFKQNLHPSWINKMPTAPLGFGHGGVIPSADIGIQLRGGLPINKMRIEFAFSIDNGPQYALGDDHHGGDGGPVLSHAGFTVDDNNDKVLGGRIGFLPIPNAGLAVSFARGGVVSLDGVGVDYGVLGFDSNWRPAFMKNLELRAEYIGKTAGDDSFSTYYVQSAYLLPHNFEAVLRYGQMDKNGDQEQQSAVGLNYLFSANIIAKLAYESTKDETTVDRVVVQLAYGF
ncbi:MAG: porin [Candidatus Marinimicrobia bacterium]|nr:porin [Candidatus Neomarinimicrobiota bacterium]